MTISKNLQALLASSSHTDFTLNLMKEFITDASERNPDVANSKMLQQLARPKYNDAIKSLNEELENLKIINRRKDVKE